MCLYIPKIVLSLSHFTSRPSRLYTLSRYPLFLKNGDLYYDNFECINAHGLNYSRGVNYLKSSK